MTTPLTKDTKAVLKLDLGKHGVRRITLAKLWDESRSIISYDRLVELAIEFSSSSTTTTDVPHAAPKAPKNNRRVKTHVVTITYTDEDGDEITISSDDELLDAFGQFVDSVPPVVRAKAIVVETKTKAAKCGNGNNGNPQGVTMKDWKQKKADMNMELMRKKRLERVQNRAQNRAERGGGNHCQPKTNPNKLNNANPNGRTTTSWKDRLNQVEPEVPFSPVIHLPPVAPPKQTSTCDKTPIGMDPNFIHGRHTCDGCLSTPIFGIRYHATNIPDYDLCSNCFGNYHGSEIVFEPQQLDRDRHLQSRWQRRRMRRCRPMTRTQGLGSSIGVTSAGSSAGNGGLESGTQTRKVIDGMDGALKEAIRRSLIEAWPVGKKKEEEEEEQEASVETETTEEEVAENVPEVMEEKEDEESKVMTEPEIAVPAVQVVDISAGNEQTQKALDEMNPKVKEALSRHLREFFARRADRKDDNGEDHDLKLSPQDEETQKKIDSMDAAMKEAVRRSLNQFFATRRATKQNEKDIQRTQEIIDTMDGEVKDKISRSLNEFFARRLRKTEDESELVPDESHNDDDVDDEEAKDDETTDVEIPSVVLDIVVDDDDDDLSEGTEDESNADTDDDSKISEDSSVKNGEWQMVTEDDEMIAVAAQMLGSALFQSDAGDSYHSSSQM